MEQYVASDAWETRPRASSREAKKKRETRIAVVDARPEEVAKQSSAEKKIQYRPFLDALKRLEAQPKDREHMYQRQGFLADGDLIQGQQILVSNHGDRFEFQCKLQPELFKKIQKKFQELAFAGGEIAHDSPDRREQVKLCNARVLALQDAQVKVFDSPIVDRSKAWISRVIGGGVITPPTYAADQTVSIEIKKSALYDQAPEKMFAELQSLMRDLLDVDQITPPHESVEKEQRIAAYAFNQNVPVESIDHVTKKQMEASVRREEVFPGYQAMVEEGRAERYLKEIPFVLTHHIGGTMDMHRCRNIISTIIKGGGLLSRTERYARGIDRPSPFLDVDMVTGGGDSVFVSMYDKNPKKQAQKDPSKAYFFVIDPSVTDRLDWYAYHGDAFGEKGGSCFQKRDGADAFIKERQHGRNRPRNELMFPHGIPLDKLLAVTCKTEKDRVDLIQHLRDQGVEEVHGKPVEEFVVIVGDSMWDRVDIGMKRRKSYAS